MFNLRKTTATQDPPETGTPLKRRERRQVKKDLSAHKEDLQQEMAALERVAEMNQGIEYDYEKGDKASTVNALRYTAMYEDGLCEISPNVYSFTTSFDNLTYQIASPEEQKRIFTKYCELLNYFPPTVNVQITNRSYFRDNDAFLKSVYMPITDNEDTITREINQRISKMSLQGDNSLESQNYLTITFAATDFQEAQALSGTIQSEIRRHFKALKCGCSPLSGVQRTELLHSYFYPHSFRFSYHDLLGSGLSSKSYVAPEAFDFDPDNHFTFTAGGVKKYGQTMVLKNLPPNMVDDLIATLTATKCEMTFSSFVRPIKHEIAMNMVKNQRAKMDMQATKIQEKNIQRMGHTGMVPFELRFSIEEADNLIEDLQKKNQRLFRVTILLYTMADSLEQLERNVFKLKSAAQKCNCEFADLPEQQEAALNSILPYGANYIDIERNLTTISTAIFIPFTVQEIQHENGLCRGQNAITNNMIVVDRESLLNANEILVGVSGSGKSLGHKDELVQALTKYPNDEFLIIDPEREFLPLADEKNGQVIEISAGSETHINPFDMDAEYGDDEAPLRFKGEFILSILECLVGEISPVARSLVDRSMRLVYKDFFKSGMKKEKTPTLTDFVKILADQPHEQAQELATALELYTGDGSLSAFSHQTNVDINNRFIVFDTLKLGDQLKSVGMMIVLDHIWNRALRNNRKGIRSWATTDEMQEYFDNSTSSGYFAKMWARLRKRGVLVTGLTQNIQRIQNDDNARYIIGNSEIVVMMSQSQGDKELLVNLLNISPDQEEYITNAEAGHGLIKVGGCIIPFVNEFSPGTELYKLMTTKPADQRAIIQGSRT